MFFLTLGASYGSELLAVSGWYSTT